MQNILHKDTFSCLSFFLLHLPITLHFERVKKKKKKMKALLFTNSKTDILNKIYFHLN